jgi:hypothetical protein
MQTPMGVDKRRQPLAFIHNLTLIPIPKACLPASGIEF